MNLVRGKRKFFSEYFFTHGYNLDVLILQELFLDFDENCQKVIKRKIEVEKG